MKQSARFLVVLLLATFVAGTGTYAAATTDMSVRMSAAIASDIEMSDCEGCPDRDGGAAACDQTCVQPFAALAALGTAESIMPVMSAEPLLPNRIIGRNGPPERHPPR